MQCNLQVFVVHVLGSTNKLSKAFDDGNARSWVERLRHGRHDTKIGHQEFDDTDGLFIENLGELAHRHGSSVYFEKIRGEK